MFLYNVLDPDEFVLVIDIVFEFDEGAWTSTSQMNVEYFLLRQATLKGFC